VFDSDVLVSFAEVLVLAVVVRADSTERRIERRLSTRQSHPERACLSQTAVAKLCLTVCNIDAACMHAA
jgi:hypothetical protein